MTEDSLDDAVVFDVERLVLDTLRQQAPPGVPSLIEPGEAIPVAVWRGAGLGAVMVLSRRANGVLVDDIFVVVDSDRGSQDDLPAGSGGEVPEWVLQRPVTRRPEWEHGHMTLVDMQVLSVAAANTHRWAVAFVLLATQDVEAISFTYGRHKHRQAVPASGLSLFAAVVENASDGARFESLRTEDKSIEPLIVLPFTESDRRFRWPAPEFWSELNPM
jgi:hypothetical protein